MPEDERKALANIAKFYREALRRDKAGRELAHALGLHDEQLLERFQVGYANGTLGRAIPSKGGVRDALTSLGVFSEAGLETAQGSLVLPLLDRQEQVVGLAAIGPDGRERRFPATASLYGLNLEAFQKEALCLADSALGLLLLCQAGLDAVAVGPQLGEEEKALLERHRPRKVYLLGEQPELLRFLQRLEVPCYLLALDLPASSSQVEAALKAAEPIGAKLGPNAVVRVAEDSLRFECGGRKYELRELAPGEEERLRVRLRALNCTSFHLDTLDLYAGRSRAAFARAAAPLLGVGEGAVEGDLALMIRKLEAMRAARKAQGTGSEPAYVMTPDEEAEALAFLRRPDLLDQVVRDLEALGYVGEEGNKRLGYLITVSRKLENPLCGVVVSRAAAGKSRLLELLAELVPPEDLV
ncbi:MAG: hypothetical protein L0170_04595, partial [Acidobacteria bacterium]|nr:hypothetical protein [Acidobacteriota bacterium]